MQSHGPLTPVLLLRSSAREIAEMLCPDQLNPRCVTGIAAHNRVFCELFSSPKRVDKRCQDSGICNGNL